MIAWVVLPFRQLYSKDSADDLFNKVCKLHSRHCPKGQAAYDWVKYYQRQFNSYLDKEVGFPLQNCTLPSRRYLDAFAYGARLVHVTSNSDIPVQDLTQLLSSYPREVVVMGYHATLRQILYTVSMAIPILRQNVNHWMKDLGWESSTAPGGKKLFEA
jgi:hypothetical protein